MKNRKIPMRSCVITREKLPKAELLRIVKVPSGEVCTDISGKMNGHGAYIKKSMEVLEKAKKTKILDKILDVEIPMDVYDEIEKAINN